MGIGNLAFLTLVLVRMNNTSVVKIAEGFSECLSPLKMFNFIYCHLSRGVLMA